MTEPCPGICNNTWRNTGEGEPRPGEPVWCPMDTARIRRLLAELDDLWPLLDFQTTGIRHQEHEPGRGNGNNPSPSPYADDLDELERMLLAWEDAYRERRGWPSPPRRGTFAVVTTTSIAWLTAHLSGVLTSPFAADFGHEIAQWHREMVSKTRAGTGRHIKAHPCPRCGLRLLSGAEGDDYVICGGCNRHMSLSEYDELADTAARKLEHAG